MLQFCIDSVAFVTAKLRLGVYDHTHNKDMSCVVELLPVLHVTSCTNSCYKNLENMTDSILLGCSMVNIYMTGRLNLAPYSSAV